MIIDETHEQYEEARLYYDVMEIGLGIMGAVGETELFRFVDHALDTFNLDQMRAIKRAYEMLSTAQQDALTGPNATEAAAREAAEALQPICRNLLRAWHIKSSIA